MESMKRRAVNGAAKGAEYERKLADYFVTLGYENARRMIRTGTVRHADEGDLDGLPFTVQAKTQARPVTDAQIAAWRQDAQAQAEARGHQLALLVVKRNGHGAIGKSWVYLDIVWLCWLAGAFPTDIWMNAGPVRISLDGLADMLKWRYPPGK